MHLCAVRAIARVLPQVKEILRATAERTGSEQELSGYLFQNAIGGVALELELSGIRGVADGLSCEPADLHVKGPAFLVALSLFSPIALLALGCKHAERRLADRFEPLVSSRCRSPSTTL
jgi:hypothetical protein